MEIEFEDSSPKVSEQELVKIGNIYKEKFFGFLNTDEELNQVLAGYFCRIFDSFVNAKSEYVYLIYLL